MLCGMALNVRPLCGKVDKGANRPLALLTLHINSVECSAILDGSEEVEDEEASLR